MPIQIQDQYAQTIAVKFSQFSGGERHVQVAASTLQGLTGTVKIRANLQQSSDWFDYLLLENVLLAQGLNIELEIPYFPYARQDRHCALGQAFSLEMITKLLNLNTAPSVQQRKTIMVWDAHSAVTCNLLKQNTQFSAVINLSAAEIIQQSQALSQILCAENSVLICPDAGAVTRTQAIAQAMNAQRFNPLEIVYCEKQRDPLTGKIVRTHVNTTDMTGLTAIISDDICDGGATFIAIAQQLRNLNCKQIILYVTHGIFSRGLSVFDGLIDQIFCSDSIAQTATSPLTTSLNIIPVHSNAGVSA